MDKGETKSSLSLSQDELLGLADAVYKEILHSNEDNGNVVHKTLDKYGYESLSESAKLFVITRKKYDHKTLSLCEFYQMKPPESEESEASQPMNPSPQIPTTESDLQDTITALIGPQSPPLSLQPRILAEPELIPVPQAPTGSGEIVISHFQERNHRNAFDTCPAGEDSDPVDMACQDVKNPLWEHILSSDKVECMKALLSRSPLYAIHKTNIPPETTWIKSAEWMQDVLHQNKARWNSSHVCNYSNEMKELGEDIMTQIAFTMHAAELFSQCCKYRSMKCMHYLLETAPNLIHMRASSEQNRLALSTAFLYNSPITDVLLEKGAVVERENSAMTLAKIYKKQYPCKNIQQATERLCKGNEDLMKQFGHDRGSLLHVFYDNIFNLENVPELQQTISCTKLLLSIGIDPTKKKYDESALEVLINRLMSHGFSMMSASDATLAAKTLTACVQILLPMFKGRPAGDVELPAFLVDSTIVSKRAVCLEFIQQLQIILDNDVYLDGIIFIFIDLVVQLKQNMLGPCSACSRVVILLFTILCKNNYEMEESRLQTLIASFIIREKGRVARKVQRAHVCRVPDGICILRSCCLWESLELLIHAGAKIGESVEINSYVFQDNEFNSMTTYLQGLLEFLTGFCKRHIKKGCHVILQRIARFVKMCWIHCTAKEEKALLETSIDDLLKAAKSNDYAQTVVEELRMFTRNVLPLKTLTRQCIMQQLEWRDVKYLPLPTALKVYLRIGDISTDHPVHTMSKAQLVA